MNFMYQYIDPADDSNLNNDEIFQRIIKQLNSFISNLNSEEDKQLLLKIRSNCYHKYHNSVRTKTKGDTELMFSTLMALLIAQNEEIEGLCSSNCN